MTTGRLVTGALIVAAGLALLVALAPFGDDGSPPSPILSAAEEPTGRLPVRTSTRHRTPPADAALDPSALDAPATGATGTIDAAHWKSTLVAQRAMCRKLQEHTVTAKWSGDSSLEAGLQILGKEIGIAIAWDETLPPEIATKPFAAEWNKESAWYVLTFVGSANGAAIHLTDEGVKFEPRGRDRDPTRVSAYVEDPFGAFEAAKGYIAWDVGFYARWTGIQECERAQVSLPSDEEIATAADLARAMGKSAAASFRIRFPASSNPVMSRSGLRSGPAADVIRSWLPGTKVVVGRGGLEAWQEQDSEQARASAIEMLDYESFRSRLENTTWPGASGDFSLNEIISALEAQTNIKAVVLLDPEVADIRVRVVRPTSFLHILEEPVAGRDGVPRRIPGDGPGWTWLSGVMIVTMERRIL